MKRGLFEWDRKRISPQEFQERLERVGTALARVGLDFLLVYADVDQGGAVRYLTNFAPYWNNALVVLPRAGDPILVTGLSRRVHGWIEEVSILRDIRSGSNLAKLAQEAIISLASSGSIGLAEADSFPAALRQELGKRLSSFTFSDATSILREARRISIPAEVSLAAEGAKLAARAIEEGVSVAGASALELAAQAERQARLAGAEDLELLVGWKTKAASQEQMGQWYPASQVGENSAEGILLSFQYMGYWTRVGRPLSNGQARQFEGALSCASLIRPGITPGQLREEMAARVGLDSPAHLVLEHMAGAFPFEPLKGQEEEMPLASGMIICVTTTGAPFWADTFLVTQTGGQALSSFAVSY